MGVSTLVEFLHKKGFADITEDLNQKLTDEEYNLLVAEYSQDKTIREEANRFLQDRMSRKSGPEEPQQEEKPAHKEPEMIETVIPEEPVIKFKTVGKINLDTPKEEPKEEPAPKKEPVKPVAQPKEKPAEPKKEPEKPVKAAEPVKVAEPQVKEEPKAEPVKAVEPAPKPEPKPEPVKERLSPRRSLLLLRRLNPHLRQRLRSLLPARRYSSSHLPRTEVLISRPWERLTWQPSTSQPVPRRSQRRRRKRSVKPRSSSASSSVSSSRSHS